jgi:hypothetical protein
MLPQAHDRFLPRADAAKLTATMEVDVPTKIFPVCRVKTRMRMMLSASWMVSLSAVAQAHPGHGEAGPSHYLTSPLHLGELGVVIAFAFAVFYAASRRSKNRAGV